jgi:hypothetical protein
MNKAMTLNYKILMILIAVVTIIGVPAVSYGQGPPPLEPGESGAYIETDIWDEIKAIGGAIVDGIKSFFGWIFG